MTDTKAIENLNKLISEVPGIQRNSSEHTRWLGNVLRVLDEIFGADSQYSTTIRVRQDTLDRIEKFNKDLTDFAVEQMTVAPLVKEFLKRLTYYQIEQNKREAVMKQNDLRIGVNK